jgi:hypothetical protein
MMKVALEREEGRTKERQAMNELSGWALAEAATSAVRLHPTPPASSPWPCTVLGMHLGSWSS